jgi:quinoprotein glucose dehydrogenase
VRSAAREVLATREPTRAIPLLAQALSSGERVERQSAARALATLRDPNVVATLAVALEKTLAGQFPADTRLDLLEAALARKHQQLDELVARIESARPKDDPLAPYLDTLEGGDAESGRRIFFERTQVSCVRCHKIDERGGDVGPDLSKIGVDKMRQYLLEAVVMPNRAIAKNFETALIITDDGKVHSGIVKSDDAQSLKLMTAEGKLLTLDKSTIDERREGKSAMPEDLVKQLSRRDLRDLVEFLAQRRGSAP